MRRQASKQSRREEARKHPPAGGEIAVYLRLSCLNGEIGPVFSTRDGASHLHPLS